jgi:4'-phosphopantetheinyl transferase EntD
MSIANKKSTILFKSLPAELTELSENLFPKSLSATAILQLAAIDRITEQDLNNWLHKKEIKQLTSYTHPKRNREWLGGRICAKEGLCSFFRQYKKNERTPQYPQHRVTNEESGRPCFVGGVPKDFLFPELSITHSQEFAAAMISSTHCGIDIQYSSEKLLRVKERFCTPDEEQLLQDSTLQHSVLIQLTLLWAGKEALKKMLSPGGIPGFHELNLQQVIPKDTDNAVLYFSRTDYPEIFYPVAAGILDNIYGIALCCQNNNF